MCVYVRACVRVHVCVCIPTEKLEFWTKNPKNSTPHAKIRLFSFCVCARVIGI